MLDEQDDPNTPEATETAETAESGAAGNVPEAAPVKRAPRKRAPAKKKSAEPSPEGPAAEASPEVATAETASVESTSAESTPGESSPVESSPVESNPAVSDPAPAKKPKKAASEGKKKSTAAADPSAGSSPEPAVEGEAGTDAPKKPKKSGGKKKPAQTEASPQAEQTSDAAGAPSEAPVEGAVTPLFKAPDPAAAAPTRSKPASSEQSDSSDDASADPTSSPQASGSGGRASEAPENSEGSEASENSEGSDDSEDSGESGGGRRRRRRGGRRRRKGSGNDEGASDAGQDPQDGDAGKSTDNASDQHEGDQSQQDGRGPQGGASKQGGKQKQGGQSGKSGGSKQGKKSTDEQSDQDGQQGKQDASAEAGEDDNDSPGSRRRRRRRRTGDDGPGGSDDPQNTVTKVRKSRSAEDEITSLSGSTRLEAKKQRRREGREAGRRRAPIVSEAEFLARRESVERTMIVRERADLTQIAVLEDKVLVEHYVARESQTSLIGNVYLGRVQNVLPSMEAAFIDIGKGRNAVLYAGEVNWQGMGHKEGEARKIESVLSSGQTVLVQVTKDPVGHKGARLTGQISLPGRFLVYVPDGNNSGISRKLPDTERARLKALLKEIVPDSAGVIVRTAAEGAAEDELTRDVERLKNRWADIEKKMKGSAPQLLYGEPDLTLKVVRDLFTEDFSSLVIEGDEVWDTVSDYVTHVAPDLADRLERYTPQDGLSVFTAYRVDEQIAKGLDRKVWLPSGGSLIIDRTEAMTVVDVNTGKFTGSGGNLEETVTKNNLEAAEEMVRQLRLRDIGGIIVIDFIDMVLESNRDLVLRRMVECLGRDRTRHQVAEVTSLGLVQMTRKRIGTGLLEAFSENCEHCGGRGLHVRDHPVDPKGGTDDDGGSRRGRRNRGGRGGRGGQDQGGSTATPPSPKDVAAMARPENMEKSPADDADAEDEPQQPASEATTSAPAVPQETPAPPATPTVVTRTRRRSASRAAGPPPETAPAETAAQAAPAPSAPAEIKTPDLPAVTHVPVKQRGSRQR